MGKVDESPHYLEILRMMLKGTSSRAIERHLMSEYGEKISYFTLNEYRKKNLNIADLIGQVEEAQRIREGKLIVDERKDTIKTADSMIIKEINQGIDVLNLIREGLSIADEREIIKRFYEDEEIDLKDKMQMTLNLSKLDLDWRKNNDTDININNQVISLRDFFKE